MSDVSKTSELIADAQAFRGSSDQYAEFITELADALEEAETERDAATERIAELEAELALHSTDGYPKRPSVRAWNALVARADMAEAERDAALALVGEVIDIHAGRIGTHYEDCYKYHVACLAVEVKRRLGSEGR